MAATNGNLFIGSLVMIVVVAVIVTIILIALKEEDSSTEQIVNYVATGVPVIGGTANPSGTKTLLYSYNGTSWIKTSSEPGFYNDDRYPGGGVGYGNDYWVAVGRNIVTDNNILYSSNGKDWVTAAREDGVSPFYNSGSDDYPGGSDVFYSTEQKLWVAVGKSDNNNNILYSSNGKSWEVATMLSNGSSVIMPGTNFLNGAKSIVYSNDLNAWVAVGKSDENNILYSNNGISWQNTTISGASAFSGSANSGADKIGGNGVTVGVSSNGADIFAAVGLDGISNLLISTNGVNWERKTATFEDGSSFFGGISSTPNSIAYDSEEQRWVAVGENDNFENNIVYSSDLSNWKTASIVGGISPFSGGVGPTPLGGINIIYSKTNNLWLAAGDGASPATKGTTILTSSNGISWNNTAMINGTSFPFGIDNESVANAIASRN